MIIARIENKALAALYPRLSTIMCHEEDIHIVEIAIDETGVRFRINAEAWSAGIGRREVADTLHTLPRGVVAIDPIDDGPHVNYEA